MHVSMINYKTQPITQHCYPILQTALSVYHRARFACCIPLDITKKPHSQHQPYCIAFPPCFILSIWTAFKNRT